MANFLLTYHGGTRPEAPEAQAKAMEAWTAWFGQLGDALVDGGNPVSVVKTIKADGSVSDGSSNPATGYSIIKADSIDNAVKAAQMCPVLAQPGASIEVSETINAM